MKNVRNTACTLLFTTFCTLCPKQAFVSKEDSRTLPEESAAEKTPNRAGATPLFRLSSAQKVSWGRSRPAARITVPGVFSAEQQGVRKHSRKENSHVTD